MSELTFASLLQRGSHGVGHAAVLLDYQGFGALISSDRCSNYNLRRAFGKILPSINN